MVENQPSIRNLEFKDFLKSKQTKSPEYNLLGTNKKDIYLLAKYSESQSFSHDTFAYNFAPREIAFISKAADPP